MVYGEKAMKGDKGSSESSSLLIITDRVPIRKINSNVDEVMITTLT